MGSNTTKEDEQKQGTSSSVDANKVEDPTFRPTSVFYITPHSSLTHYIRVYSIEQNPSGTQSINDLLTSSSKAGQSIAKTKTEKPAYTIVQGGLFGKAKVYAGEFVEGSTSKDGLIAEWNPSRIPHGTNTFTFLKPTSPSGEPGREPPHPLTLKRTTLISSRAESFVKDSVEYVWGFDNRFNDSWMTLVAKVGGREVVVAKGYRPWNIEYTGGSVVVDGERVDALSVVLTAVAMLRKLRQRTKR